VTTVSTEFPASLPELDLAVGSMVGEYRVEVVLGRGAFGTVYRATQPLIGKVVAIKVLARRFSADPEMVSRFVAEARAVNQIRHRHIIDIFSFGQLDDGRHYYVMEYLDGDSLDVVLQREGRLGLAYALPILRAIGRALDAAHGKGIAHRDLKAENVFVARDDDGAPFPKLLDFGIAKLLAPDDGLKHKTRTGTPVGTPYYMSPEQCKGRDVDHRTDLYAFGVLAYRMLVGEYPFDADDAMSIMMKQLADQPVPASTIVDELPPGVDDAIAWLMAKDPADRPPCARDAVRALEQAAEQAGIVIGAPSAAWDVQTGPEGRAYGTQPPNTRSRVASAGSAGLRAPSRPSSGAATVVPSRSRVWIVVIATAAILAGATGVYLATRPSDELSSPAAGPTNPTAGPTNPTAGPTKPAPAPAPSAFVIATIDGVPDGTEVTIAGVTVGVAPEQLVLTFKVDGYLPQSRAVTPDRDQRFAVALKKKAVAAPPSKRPGKDDILDPFGNKP